MAFIATRSAPTVRRLLLAVTLAGAAMLAGGATGGTGVACAAPKWNKDAFYRCWDPIHEQYVAGDITTAQYNDHTEACCQTHGGRYDWDTHLCRAPAAAPATSAAPPPVVANPDVPAGSAPSTGKPPTPKTPFRVVPVAPSAPVG